MFTRPWALLPICMLLLFCIPAADAARISMPPGSFITRPVKDVEDLCLLIEGDKLVAARFSKHFGMSPAALTKYFRDNLKPSVSHAGKYVEFYIGKNGLIRVHSKTLKAGERILVAFNNQPIVHMKCGNPFTKVLPKPVIKVKSAVQSLPPPPVCTESPLSPPELAPVIGQVEPLEPVVLVLAQPPLELVSSRSASWILPAVVGGGALAGGNSSDEPIPEPAGLLALGIGIAGLALSGYRRMRRR